MGFAHFKHVKLSGIACAIPYLCENIDDKLALFDNSVQLLERSKKILGLGTKYITDGTITTLDLSLKSSKTLIESLGLDKKRIDCIIHSSVTADYPYPGLSCILQGKLGLDSLCTAYDISGVSCSAFVLGLMQVSALIESRAIQNCLYICGDIASTNSNPKNKNTNILFGDASCAVFLEHSEEQIDSYYLTGTMGERWDRIVAPAGGKALPIDHDILDLEVTDKNGNIYHLTEDILKGMDVFQFSSIVGPKCIKDLLEYAKLSVDDIDYFAIHQANGQIVKSIGKLAALPTSKYSFDTFNKYGNCASASLGTVLCHKCKNYKDVMLCSFGIGLSFANAIVDLSSCKNLGFSTVEKQEKPSRQERIDSWVKYFKGEVDKMEI